MNTDNFDKEVLVTDGGITIQPAKQTPYLCYPFFLKQPIEDGFCFKVDVVNAGQWRGFRIGVGVSKLKPCEYASSKINNVCVHGNGYLFLKNQQNKCNFSLSTGDIITVRRSGSKIEWLRKDEVLVFTEIPQELIKQKLFPMIMIQTAG